MVSRPLSTDLDDDEAVPYFLWDDPLTVRELKQILAHASAPERDRWLGKVLRQARDTDVWRFTTPDEVVVRWATLEPHLGQRRGLWSFLLGEWRRQGLLRGA